MTAGRALASWDCEPTWKSRMAPGTAPPTVRLTMLDGEAPCHPRESTVHRTL